MAGYDRFICAQNIREVSTWGKEVSLAKVSGGKDGHVRS